QVKQASGRDGVNQVERFSTAGGEDGKALCRRRGEQCRALTIDIKIVPTNVAQVREVRTGDQLAAGGDGGAALRVTVACGRLQWDVGDATDKACDIEFQRLLRLDGWGIRQAVTEFGWQWSTIARAQRDEGDASNQHYQHDSGAR